MNTDRKTDAVRCIDGLMHYAIERRLGFESHQVGNIGINPELREVRTRELIRGIAEQYNLACEAQALVNSFDERMAQARGCFGVQTASHQQQYATVQGLLRYAKDLAGSGQDRRDKMLLVSDHFEDMVSHLPWDARNNQLYPAKEWMDMALPRMTAGQNILFTRVLLGAERGPAMDDFVGGSVTDPAEVAKTALFDDLSGQYPEIAEWPAMCTVYRGGYEHGKPRNATELDLTIMRKCGPKFLDLPGVSVCRYPEQMTVAREQRLGPENPAKAPDISKRVEKELARYAASEEFAVDISARKNDYVIDGRALPSDAVIKAEVLAGQKDFIRRQIECEETGHQLTDHADGENGRGTLECNRCGLSQQYQW